MEYKLAVGIQCERLKSTRKASKRSNLKYISKNMIFLIVIPAASKLQSQASGDTTNNLFSSILRNYFSVT